MILRISPEGIAINKRFFLALNVLHGMRKLGGLKTFTDKYKINYWNMTTVRNEPERRFLKPEWLSFLVSDYKINAHWLLTGQGSMFNKTYEQEIGKSLQVEK